MAPTLRSRCGDAVDEGCDPKDELAELDTLLKRLTLNLKRKINRLHSPIIRHLPPDVMSTIFEFCLPYFTDHHDQPLAFTQKDSSFPLSLGAICSYWRDIAWSTPSLWSSLVVRVTSKHNPHIIAGVAQEWLARSGQLPLTIRVLAFDHDLKTISALADIINRYSTRWSYLDLRIPSGGYQHHAIDNHAPTLKSIRFYSSSFDPMSLNYQLTCPRLERATLENFIMNGPNIQWDNLTHLNLYSMSTIDAFLILSKTPRLVFCRVLSYHTQYGPENIGPIVLTSLRSLHLHMDYAVNTLDSIIAPHLEELSLPNYQNLPMEVITSFLRRSACSLRSFSTTFCSVPPHFDETFMISFRSINILSITSFFDSSQENYDLWNILQLMAGVLSSQSTSPQRGFLPDLQILEYTGNLRLPARSFFLLDALLYTLPPADNTVRGPLRLFKINIHSTTRIPKKMMTYFSSLEERGVTVNVLSKSEDILQSSIDYYRGREESLCWDWAVNLDLSLFQGKYIILINRDALAMIITCLLH